MTRDYFGYTLALVSILAGILVSWYFYEESKQLRSPVLVVDFFPSIIYNANKEPRLPFKVLREDGRVLDKSAHLSRHVSWNKGNHPITAADVLTPVRVTMSNPDAEILSVSVSEVSREVVGCEARQEGDRSFRISFRILEENDGCVLKLIYAGNRFPAYELRGDMVGVRKIEVISDTLTAVVDKAARA